MLVAGFRGNISEKIVKDLDDKDSYIIDNSLSGIQKFIDFIKKTNPDKILIFGQYSGKDNNKLRIEVVCSNKFKNKIDGSFFQQYAIPYFFEPSKRFKLAQGIGNSWCNLVSYKIVTNFPDMPFTFIHVPKDLVSTSILHSIKVRKKC